jgi:hypothetical protein
LLCAAAASAEAGITAHRNPELRSKAVAILFDFDPVLMIRLSLPISLSGLEFAGDSTGGAVHSILAPDSLLRAAEIVPSYRNEPSLLSCMELMFLA